MVSSDFIFQNVFPALGVLTGNFMSFAPYSSVLKASRQGTLGDLNPTPWVFMLGNYTGWLAYSFLTGNMYILLSTAPGFVLAVWLNIQAIKLQYENFRSVELQKASIHALESTRSNNRKNNSFSANKQQRAGKGVEQVLATEEETSAEMSAVVLEEDGQGNRSHPRSIAYQTISIMQHDIERNGSEAHCILEQMDHDVEELYHNDWHNDCGTSTAPEVTIDYASFIREMAPQKTLPAPVFLEMMVVGMSTFWLLLISYVVFFVYQANAASGVSIIGIAGTS
jgi:hypothetical protein